MSLLPLALLWLWSQRSGGGLSMPRWPTPASPPPAPPPPMSAFEPKAPPVQATATDAATATPLAELHQAPPVPPTPSTAAPKVRRKRAPPGTPTGNSRVAVRDLQRVLNARGAKLAPDGLYGPKTAAAWSALARKKTLPPAISRVDARTARVATKTYDALSVPAIP